MPALGRAAGVRIGSVDAVVLEASADDVARRSVEDEPWALDLAVRALELTALERSATPGRAQSLCGAAARSTPPLAAVCVRTGLVAACREWLRGTGVRLAAATSALPPDLMVAEAARAVALGAEEIEVPLDCEAFLCGRHAAVYEEIAQVREAVGDAVLRVSLGTDELGTYDDVRRASLLAILAGADFLVAGERPGSAAGALPTGLCVLQAIRDVHDAAGRAVGFASAACAGGAEEATRLPLLVRETLGPDWLTPQRFRIAFPGLLDDLLPRLREQRTGVFAGRDALVV